MTVAYRITPELRTRFKEPFGTLISGSFDDTMAKMKELVAKELPPKIVSVGDVVTWNLHQHNIRPQISIIDGKSLRDQAMPAKVGEIRTIHVSNPQGTITNESVQAIREAFARNEHTHIIVEGEEDLLALISIQFAPPNSFVIYGQPHSGIVVVRVTPKKRAQVQEFLKAMEHHEKLNKKRNV